MEIAQEQRGAVSVLAPVGRLDTDSAADLELAVQDLINAGAVHFVVDLAQINYVSSAGLRVLLMLAKSVDGKGSLRVAGLNAQVQQVFDIAGFTKLFAIYPDRDAALHEHPAARAAPAGAAASAPREPAVVDHVARMLGVGAARRAPIGPEAKALGRHAAMLLCAKLDGAGASAPKTTATKPAPAAARAPADAPAEAEKGGFFSRLFGKKKRTI